MGPHERRGFMCNLRFLGRVLPIFLDLADFRWGAVSNRLLCDLPVSCVKLCHIDAFRKAGMYLERSAPCSATDSTKNQWLVL